MHRSVIGIGFVTAWGILGACSSASGESTDSFPTEPLTTVESDNLGYSLDVWTSPDQPPVHGIVSAKLAITDATSHGPADGLILTVVPEMPSMGHGTSITPTVEPQGGGLYLVRSLSLYMPGRWDLTITLDGHFSDTATIPLDVH